MQCTGKVVLVTGAQQGIGRAMALEFARAGADVAVNWLDDERAATGVAEGVRAAGRSALMIQADVAGLDAVRVMVAAVGRGLGPVDILVNNAGLQQDAPFHEMSLAQWNTVIAVNLTGQFLCARAAVREFLKRGVDAGLIPGPPDAEFLLEE